MSLCEMVCDSGTETYLHRAEGIGYAIAESFVYFIDVGYIGERNTIIEYTFARSILVLESKAIACKAVVIGIREKLLGKVSVGNFQPTPSQLVDLTIVIKPTLWIR